MGVQVLTLERNLCRIDPIVPVIDPAEWHTGPFCQVYIAACERLDHYQTKVKPALQAFVSQIESAASNTAANQQGGHSADYLIVYVQINGRASTANKYHQGLKSMARWKPDGNSATRRGLFQRARKRWTAAGATAGGSDEDDAKSTASIDGNTRELTHTADTSTTQMLLP
ncbi:hypothetical protein IV203_004695 [Nitzschia inconspicua]|uniref:Uncharacterized protein n=1 Tax=Nitzschia inconspicua TaxID=303405 RepID=A0A9K3L463_9STRA|nr:hypothetical protein IV203_004695 [Nitzschia inconspicua]